MTTNKTKRNWVIVVAKDEKGPVFLGTAGVGDVLGNGRDRQGVRKLENATRFTQRGAMRILNAYPTAKADGSAYIQQVPA